MKKIAVITDIHGNLEALRSILEDIKVQEINEIICLGDTIGIGPNSKECIDLLIENNIKSVLGEHEIYLLKGTDFDSTISEEKKEHCRWIRESLTDKEVDYIRKCPLYYEITLDYDNAILNKKYILCHYLLDDQNNIYPFEKNHLREDINLWKKYNNDSVIYFVGHLHQTFDINEVDGILGDFIEDEGALTNIEIVESAGCTKDEYISYTIIEISKSNKFERRRLKYDRDDFIDKVLNTEFPDKKNILQCFYGIDCN